MSFIRKIADEPIKTEHMRGGAGYVLAKRILNDPDEMYKKGRLFNHMTLDPGCEVGLHMHDGDGETYYILKGRGKYYDGKDKTVEVGPGDIMFCGDGEYHGMINDGDEPIEFIALILYS